MIRDDRGREALEKRVKEHKPQRKKVTFAWNGNFAARVPTLFPGGAGHICVLREPAELPFYRQECGPSRSRSEYCCMPPARDRATG